MTQTHYRILAVIGGLAVGFFATRWIVTNLNQGHVASALYNQGITSGGNYNV
jgi:hypothetical protein